MIELLEKAKLTPAQRKEYERLKKEEGVESESDSESEDASSDSSLDYTPITIVPVNPFRKPGEEPRKAKTNVKNQKRRKRRKKRRLPPHVVPVRSRNPHMCSCSHPAPYPVTRPKPKPGINPFVTHHAPPKSVKYKLPKYKAPTSYYEPPPPDKVKSVFSLESIWSVPLNCKYLI